MSTNVAIGGFSIKLNEEDQSEKRLKKISKSLCYEWKDNLEWDEIIFNQDKFIGQWKPNIDVYGTYGFIYITNYEYDAYGIEYCQPISAIEIALKSFIDKTKIIPKEEIKSFVIIYYNGGDNPFKF